nr:type II toxin-antitoxin system VapC family toxin [Sphingomonas xinjiangensis]
MLDASALLALMLGEDGAEAVHAVLPNAQVSTVNLSEVIAKLQEKGVPNEVISSTIAELDLDVVPFDRAQAVHAGLLRAHTRSYGLSLGDRACLAAAAAAGATAVTSDRAWSKLKTGVLIEVVR